MDATPVSIPIPHARPVAGLLNRPRAARACFVFAHGAGAGMTHPFMAAFAADLATRDVACLRYQFPFMERGSRRPDAPAVAQAAVRAAVAAAADLAPGVPLFAGGRSFGGRMTSQAQAAAPLPRVRGVCFLGFPLHPAGKPGVARAAHLADVCVPMLFLQGDRDALADLALLRPIVEQLGPRASLVVIPRADHSFHVPARNDQAEADVRRRLAEALAGWMAAADGR
ncbi:MAG: alpha/beta hydrolase [Betaproteobacteria bacterium]|nr:MAG: alpha/beta hydrolase [Betaproteobacteria bacterium]